MACDKCEIMDCPQNNHTGYCSLSERRTPTGEPMTRADVCEHRLFKLKMQKERGMV